MKRIFQIDLFRCFYGELHGCRYATFLKISKVRSDSFKSILKSCSNFFYKVNQKLFLFLKNNISDLKEYCLKNKILNQRRGMTVKTIVVVSENDGLQLMRIFVLKISQQLTLFDMSTQESKANSFITKFYSILTDSRFEETLKFDEFKGKIYIFDREKMQIQILPHYFRHNNFSSFIRQLNLYGFKKIKNNGHTCFTHPKLERGEKFLSIIAKRKEKHDKDALDEYVSELVCQNNQRQLPPRQFQGRNQDQSFKQVLRNSEEFKLVPVSPIAFDQNVFIRMIPPKFHRLRLLDSKSISQVLPIRSVLPTASVFGELWKSINLK